MKYLLLFFLICLTSLHATAQTYSQKAQLSTQVNTHVEVKADVKDLQADIEFLFPQDPLYTSALIKGRLIISFKDKVDLEPEAIKKYLSKFVSDVMIHNQNQVLVLTLNDGVTSDLKAEKKSLFLKLTKKEEAPKENPPPPVNAEDVPAQNAKTQEQKTIKPENVQPYEIWVRGGLTKDYERLTFELPEKVPYKVYQEETQIVLEIDHPGFFFLDEIEKTPFKLIRQVEDKKEEDKIFLGFKTPHNNRIEHFLSDTNIVLDVFHELNLPQQVDQSLKNKIKGVRLPPEFSKDLSNDQPEPSKSEAASVDLSSEKKMLLITDTPISIASFMRGSNFYVILNKKLFDDSKLSDYVKLPKEYQHLLTPVPHEEVTAFMLKDIAFVNLELSREGTNWIFNFDLKDFETFPNLKVIPESSFSLGARLVVESEDAQKVIDFKDPIMGDVLKVIPLPSPNTKISDEYYYPEFKIIPSYQGVVLELSSDLAYVRPFERGLEITSRRKGGLIMSSTLQHDQLSYEHDLDLEPPYLLPQEWQMGPERKFSHNERELLQHIVTVEPDLLNRKRLDLARFYFSHAFAQEASAVLQTILSDDPKLENHPEFKSLRGATSVLRHDFEDAYEDLYDPDLRDHPEIGLWQAMASDNDFYATQLFLEGFQYLDLYPEPLKTMMSIRALEAFFNVHATSKYDIFLNNLKISALKDENFKPAYRYYKALSLIAQNKPEEAEKLLRMNFTSKDRLYRAKSKYELVEMNLERNAIDHKQAIDYLESLSFAWRGDDFEVEVLTKLFDLYLEQNMFQQAFEKGRYIATIYPDHLLTKYIPEEMSEQFADLFLSDKIDVLSPFELYALYETYSELTPVGEKGDQIVQRLADKMVKADLLDKAIELLNYQVMFRLIGPEKDKAALKLAGIMTLNDQYDDALNVLDKTINEKEADLTILEERQLLRAHIFLKKGYYDMALDLLKGNSDREAEYIKYLASWRKKDWQSASFYLTRLIGAPDAYIKQDTIDPEIKSFILSNALALAMLKDTSGLEKIRRDFGGIMAKTDDFTSFNLITQNYDTLPAKDKLSIREKAQQVDLFKKFLEKYQKVK